MAFPRRDDLPLWLANAIPYLFLVLLLGARLSIAWAGETPGQLLLGGIAATALIATTALVMAGKVARHLAGWLLAGQAVLTLAPYLWLGTVWGTTGGLLAFSIMMALRPGRVTWSLAALAILADVVARGVVHDSVPAGLAALGVDGNVAIVLFGLTRMRDLIVREHAVRQELLRLEVAEETLRAARDLRRGLGAELSSIVRLSSTTTRAQTEQLVAAARRALASARQVADGFRSRSPAEELQAARAVLSAAGIEVSIRGTPASGDLAPALRPLVLALVSGQVTTCAIDARDPALLRVSWQGNANLPDVPGLRIGPGHVAELPTPPSPHRQAPQVEVPRRLATRLLALSVSCYTLLAFVNTWSDGAAPSTIWLAGLTGAVLAALTVHLIAPRANDHPPAGWRWFLALQLAITAAVLLFHPLSGPALAPLGLVVGSVLVRAGFLWSVPAAVVIWASMSSGVFPALYMAVSIVSTTLCLYAFNRLPALSRRLRETQQELARLAVVKERLRVSRDIHDLLGFHLSAIALKGDLATTLPSDQAAQHLTDIAAIAKRALTDFRSITGEPAGLTLADELSTTRSLLDAAGVAVHANLTVPVPPRSDALLAIVLREAITNVVRHAAATRCQIDLTGEAGTVMLRISNDGAHTITEGGSGLPNLRTRVEENDGVLTYDLTGDRFTLTISV
ncbi:sensor histidine kinase [Nonomuraea endophytica]|uniref:sensor histidine kinase n=1 Tax=Nonomuraea endophytica TaxID=714136 RepID=UPI0037CAC5DC